MIERKELCEVAEFTNIRGEIEVGLLRITPPIPGKPRGELPIEVPISSAPSPQEDAHEARQSKRRR